jgi:hypothetical protein
MKVRKVTVTLRKDFIAPAAVPGGDYFVTPAPGTAL